jgi:Flp pilus assembly protein TadG
MLKRRAEGGAAAVETALCICFIVQPLTFAIIAYAYMLSFRQSVSQAAAEGARAAAVAPPDSTSGTQPATNSAAIQAAINSTLTSGVSCNLTIGTLARGGATVGTCTVATNGTSKQVTIDYDYKNNPLLPIPGLGFVMPDHLTYAASAEVSQ